MLPLTLLKAGEGSPVLVELKSGETYNGHMVGINSHLIHVPVRLLGRNNGECSLRPPPHELALVDYPSHSWVISREYFVIPG